MSWNPLIVSPSNFFKETFHILGMERWLQCSHLVEHAPKRPDIWFVVIGLVFSDFGTKKNILEGRVYKGVTSRSMVCRFGYRVNLFLPILKHLNLQVAPSHPYSKIYYHSIKHVNLTSFIRISPSGLGGIYLDRAVPSFQQRFVGICFRSPILWKASFAFGVLLFFGTGHRYLQTP